MHRLCVGSQIRGSVLALRSGVTFTPYVGGGLLCHGTHENEEVLWGPRTRASALCCTLSEQAQLCSFPCNGIWFGLVRVKGGSGLVRYPKQVETLSFPEWLQESQSRLDQVLKPANFCKAGLSSPCSVLRNLGWNLISFGAISSHMKRLPKHQK